MMHNLQRSAVLTVALFGAAAMAAAPNVVRIQYADRFVSFDSEQYNFVQVGLTFDQNLAINTTMCPDGSDDCQIAIKDLPIQYWEQLTLGLASMTCDGQPHTHNQPNLECFSLQGWEECEMSGQCHWNGDESDGMCQPNCNDGPCTPMSVPPQRRDALAAIFAGEAKMDDYLRNLVLQPNRLIFLFFRSVKDLTTGQEYPIGYAPVSKMAAGRCQLHLDTDRLVSAATGESVNSPPTSLTWEEKPPVCDQTQLFQIVENFDRALSGLKGVNTLEDMEAARARIMVETSKDAWFGCENIIRKAMVEGDRSITRESKDCVAEYGTMEYEMDPCCNYELQNTLCCAPREITQTITALVDVDASYVALQCSNKGSTEAIKKVIDALDNYVSAERKNNNPDTGCSAAFARATGGSDDRSDVWNTFTAFIDECNEEIFGTRGSGSGKECSTDDDCYTECQTSGESTSDTGNCAVPYGNPAPYLQACYIDKMDADIKGRLLRLWGVYNVNNETAFEAKFVENTATDRCVGPTEWLYNGGWFRNRSDDYGDYSGDYSGDGGSTGGGGEYCECPCEGPDCPAPCEGPDCPPTCADCSGGGGEYCECPCEGPDCPAPCEGPDCPPTCADCTGGGEAGTNTTGTLGVSARRRKTKPAELLARIEQASARGGRVFRVKPKTQRSAYSPFTVSRLGGMLVDREERAAAKRILNELRSIRKGPATQASRRHQVARHARAHEGRRLAAMREQAARGAVRAQNYEDNERFHLDECWGGSERDLIANGCFWLETDVEGCTAEQQCNWGDYSADNATCSRDVMGNGGYMCGDCYGGQFCWERSRLPKCILNDYNFQGWTEQDCTNAGGNVVADQWDPSRQYCTASTDSLATCLDSCMGEGGPRPAPEEGCIRRDLTDDECYALTYPDSDWHYAWVHWLPSRDGRTANKVCRTWTNGAAECDAEFGAQGFAWERLQAEDSEYARLGRCGRNYCYNLHTPSAEHCQAYNELSTGFWFEWRQNLNNGTGACVTWINEWERSWANLTATCEGVGANWTYYHGREYREGSVYTEEQCTAGVCEHNDGLTEAECAAESFCTFGCQGCTAGWQSTRQHLCFHTNATACGESGKGSWNGERCDLDVDDRADCTGEGGTYVSCSDYSEDECYSNDYQSELQCEINWRQCEDQEECEAQGECSDWNLSKNPYSHAAAGDAESDDGVCVFPKIMNRWGYLDCRADDFDGARYHSGDDGSPPQCPEGTVEYHCPPGLTLAECMCFCDGRNPDSSQCCNLCPDGEECAWDGLGDEFPDDAVADVECEGGEDRGEGGEGGGDGPVCPNGTDTYHCPPDLTLQECACFCDAGNPESDNQCCGPCPEGETCAWSGAGETFPEDSVEPCTAAARAPALMSAGAAAPASRATFTPFLARAVAALADNATGADGNETGPSRPEDLQWVENGCLSRDLEQVECEGAGGTWMHRATTEEECTAGELRTGCCEPGRDCYNQLSQKNATECAKCGGEIVEIFSWHGGQWTPGRIKPLDWIQRERKPVNEYKAVVNERLMRQFIDKAVGSRIAEAYRADLKCRFAPKRNVMKTIACNCGTSLSGECAAQEQRPQATELTDTEVFCGQSKTISASGFEVELGAESIQTCDREVSVSLSALPANAKAGDSSSSGAGRRVRRRLLAAADEAACYASVINANSQVVGQLRGDCLTFTASGEVSNVELCLPLKESITHDPSSYPDAGVATHSLDGSLEDVYTATSLVTFDGGSSFCVTVSASGTYCPVSLMDAWASQTSTTPVSCGTSSALEEIARAVTQLAGGATELEFTAQPTAAAAGESIGTVTVSFVDDSGAVATTAAASATLSIKPGTGTTGAVVTGTPRVVAVNGVAVFEDVQISKSGSGYVLVASSAGLVSAQSSAFSIAAGDPAAVAFRTQPAGCVQGAACLQQPVATIVDIDGNVASSTATVTLKVDGGDGSTVATAVAVAGVATFTTVQFADLDSSVRLTAEVTGLTGGVSEEFAVVSSTGVAVRLAISAVSAVEVDESLLVTVQVQDGSAALVSSSTASVSLDIVDGTGSSGATLSGSVVASAVSGVATFAVSINRAATGYQLVATSTGLASSTSAEFTVNGPSAVVFATQPADADLNNAIGTVTVTVQDVAGDAYTGSEYVTLGLNQGPGVLRGVVRKALTAGSASFTGLTVDGAGTYSVVAVTDGGITASSSSFTITDPNAGDDDDDDDDSSPAAVASTAQSAVLTVCAVLCAIMARF